MDQLEQKQTELSVQSKMAALGTMAGGVAHEINNPLAMIDGFIRRVHRKLSESGTLSPVVDEALKKSAHCIERITKIVRGLKHIPRDASNDPFELAAAKQILADSLQFLEEKLLNRNILLEVHCPEDFQLKCREVQISQILISLVGNSADAIQDQISPWIRIEAKASENGHCEFTVLDSGKTPSDEIADKIMHPFFTTKTVGKGTGLGLSLSLAIAQGHRGTLCLDRKCRNTTFRLRLPLSQQAEAPKNVA